MNTHMHRPLAMRIGALTCAGALCLGMLGGCSGGSDSSGSAASASPSATAEGTEAPAKDEAKDLTDEEVLDRIIKANGSFTELDHPVRQVTTTSMDFGADSGMGTIETEVTMETGVDPIRFRHVTKTSAASLDEGQEIVRWGEVQDDGSISVWVPGTDGGWQHQTTSAEDAQALLDSSSTANQLRSVLETNKDAVTLTREGDSYRLKMDIPHDKVMELLGDSIEQMAMGGEVTFKNYTIDATFDAKTFYETEMKNDFSFDFDLQGKKNSLTAKSTTTMDHNPKDLDVTIPDEVRSAA